MDKQKQDDQPELTYSSYVRTRDVTQKTCRRWWTIGKSGKRWSRISVLAARLDDDDDDADDPALLLNTSAQAALTGTSKRHRSPRWLRSEFMFFNQDGTISSLNGKPLKSLDWFIYLGSNISSAGSYVNIRMNNVWWAIDSVMTMWKFDLSITLVLIKHKRIFIVQKGNTKSCSEKEKKKKKSERELEIW